MTLRSIWQRQGDWLLLAAAGALGLLGFFWRGSGMALEPGLRVEKVFTFVPADRVHLACRSELAALADCGAAALDQRIVPAVTIDRELLLVRGVLASPEFAARGPARTQRFSLACHVTYREQVEGVGIRFASREPFHPAAAWLVDVDGCQLK